MTPKEIERNRIKFLLDVLSVDKPNGWRVLEIPKDKRGNWLCQSPGSPFTNFSQLNPILSDLRFFGYLGQRKSRSPWHWWRWNPFTKEPMAEKNPYNEAYAKQRNAAIVASRGKRGVPFQDPINWSLIDFGGNNGV